MKEPVLVILAAGMGSRYGGLKQIDPVGPNGEKIIDYSLYDAKRAGFKRAMFVIKEERQEEFQRSVFSNMGWFPEISTSFQKLEDIPAFASVPEGRVKPWGTAHAALEAARHLEEGTPYAVINADDFYGREAFAKIYDFLSTAQDGEIMDFAMVGYYLKNTVTDNGFVSRGVCETEDGFLSSIRERIHIEKRPEGIAYTENGGQSWIPLSGDSVVSMNLWGFTPGFTGALEQDFERFFREDVPANPLKAEFLLPFVVDGLLKEGKARVKALSSPDRWYGVTYKEDKPMVQAGIRSLIDAGQYPVSLQEG